ncbi:MAG: LCP family protein [Clostridia bacterium]|nr:LCP family protein [Clostridia bacterium]
MSKKRIWIIAFVILATILGASYLVYDLYFRLPVDVPLEESGSEENEECYFGNFNVLILGLDGRKGINDRSDTIILASLDEKNKKAQLLSIPRDTRVKVKGAWDKINAAYAYGGLDLTTETLTKFLNVEIDRYVIINFNSLVRLVDMVDGIDLNVPVRMYKPLEGIDLQPGQQHLEGKQVLAYSRFRDTKAGDIDRARRQQEVIQLLAEKVVQGKNITHLPEMFNNAKENVDTDLTIREMGALVRLAPAIIDNGVATKVFPGENKKIDGIWYWEPDLSNMVEVLSITSQKE